MVIGVALWLAVIVVGSGVTWVFIDRVGRDVTAQSAPGLVPAEQAPTPEQGPARSLTPSARPEPTASRAPSARPTPGGRESETPAPATTDDGGSSDRPARPPRRTEQPRTPPPEQEPQQGQAVTRTWVGDGGRVTASCRGSEIALQSASPSNGWRVEVGERGPQRVEVKFEQQGAEESEVQVDARCSGGQPRFRVGDD